jgi:hypothetical protein
LQIGEVSVDLNSTLSTEHGGAEATVLHRSSVTL